MAHSKKRPDFAALFESLAARFGEDRVLRNEPLAAHTTLRLGGPASLWVAAKSVDELVSAANLARQHQTSCLVLGGGANLLIREAGFKGLVIGNRAAGVRFEGSTVTAESGAILPRLVKRCAQQGLSGLEWAIGVPGTVGGAVVNNAGAYGSSIADSLIRAELLDETGNRAWHSVGWFDYDYRHSTLKTAGLNKQIVLQAELALSPAPTEAVEALTQTVNKRRKAGQPPGATGGSMFKNPPGDFAGRLIEAAGLKGHRIGQAQISPVHANFFVNLGEASADDVIALVELAQAEVLAQFGVRLEMEVEII